MLMGHTTLYWWSDANYGNYGKLFHFSNYEKDRNKIFWLKSESFAKSLSDLILSSPGPKPLVPKPPRPRPVQHQDQWDKSFRAKKNYFSKWRRWGMGDVSSPNTDFFFWNLPQDALNTTCNPHLLNGRIITYFLKLFVNKMRASSLSKFNLTISG